MFTLELSNEQIKNCQGFIVLWNGGEKISNVTFELTLPSDTKTVAKLIPLEEYSVELFSGLGDYGARIEFTDLGSVVGVIPIDE